MAGRAGRVRPGQEEQLDGDEALALARLAASFGDVEGEAARAVAALARLGGGGIQPAHGVEESGVRGEVGARGTPDRALVDADQPVEGLEAGGVVDVDLELRLLGVVGALAEVAAHQLGEHLGDQRRLARPRDAGDGRQDAERDVDGDVVEVVPADAAQVQPSLGFALRTWGSLGAAEQMLPGHGCLDVLEPATGPE